MMKRNALPLIIHDGEQNCDSDYDEFSDTFILKEDHNIYFHQICNKQYDNIDILIDEKIETDETDCNYWPCNNTYTNCNGFWSCHDGADEINCLPSNCSEFYHACVFPNDTSKVSCLPIEQAGNGIIDCFGATDERNHCQEYYQTAHDVFKCSNDDTCLVLSNLCNDVMDCPDDDDEKFWKSCLLSVRIIEKESIGDEIWTDHLDAQAMINTLACSFLSSQIRFTISNRSYFASHILIL